MSVNFEKTSTVSVTTTTYKLTLLDGRVVVYVETASSDSWRPVTNSITSILVNFWGCPDFIDVLPFTAELSDTDFGVPVSSLTDEIIGTTQSVLADLFTPFLHLKEDVEDDSDEEEGFKW